MQGCWLLWRYGHSWRADDPLVLLDSEAQIGFSSRLRRGTADAAIRRRLQLRDSESIPRKLDALGVLPTGNLAVVEVKDTGETSCVRLTRQRFTRCGSPTCLAVAPCGAQSKR